MNGKSRNILPVFVPVFVLIFLLTIQGALPAEGTERGGEGSVDAERVREGRGETAPRITMVFHPPEDVPLPSAAAVQVFEAQNITSFSTSGNFLVFISDGHPFMVNLTDETGLSDTSSDTLSDSIIESVKGGNSLPPGIADRLTPAGLSGPGLSGTAFDAVYVDGDVAGFYSAAGRNITLWDLYGGMIVEVHENMTMPAGGSIENGTYDFRRTYYSMGEEFLAWNDGNDTLRSLDLRSGERFSRNTQNLSAAPLVFEGQVVFVTTGEGVFESYRIETLEINESSHAWRTEEGITFVEMHRMPAPGGGTALEMTMGFNGSDGRRSFFLFDRSEFVSEFRHERTCSDFFDNFGLSIVGKNISMLNTRSGDEITAFPGDPSFSGNAASLSDNPPSFSGNAASLSDNPPSFSGNAASLSDNPPSFSGNTASLLDNPPPFSGNLSPVQARFLSPRLFTILCYNGSSGNYSIWFGGLEEPVPGFTANPVNLVGDVASSLEELLSSAYNEQPVGLFGGEAKLELMAGHPRTAFSVSRLEFNKFDIFTSGDGDVIEVDLPAVPANISALSGLPGNRNQTTYSTIIQAAQHPGNLVILKRASGWNWFGEGYDYWFNETMETRLEHWPRILESRFELILEPSGMNASAEIHTNAGWNISVNLSTGSIHGDPHECAAAGRDGAPLTRIIFPDGVQPLSVNAGGIECGLSIGRGASVDFRDRIVPGENTDGDGRYDIPDFLPPVIEPGSILVEQQGETFVSVIVNIFEDRALDGATITFVHRESGVMAAFPLVNVIENQYLGQNDFTGMPGGEYDWTIAAADESGGLDSLQGIFNYDEPPDIEDPGIISFTGQVRENGSVLLTAKVTDNTGVAGVEFLYRRGSIGAWVIVPANKTGIDEYSTELAGLDPGTYHWKVVARDGAGNTAEGPGRTFTVPSGDTGENGESSMGIVPVLLALAGVSIALVSGVFFLWRKTGRAAGTAAGGAVPGKRTIAGGEENGDTYLSADADELGEIDSMEFRHAVTTSFLPPPSLNGLDFSRPPAGPPVHGQMRAAPSPARILAEHGGAAAPDAAAAEPDFSPPWRRTDVAWENPPHPSSPGEPPAPPETRVDREDMDVEWVMKDPGRNLPRVLGLDAVGGGEMSPSDMDSLLMAYSGIMQTQETIDGIGKKLGVHPVERISAARPLESLSKVIDAYFRQALRLKNIEIDMDYLKARGITIPERYGNGAAQRPASAEFVQDYGPGMRVSFLGNGIWEVSTPLVTGRRMSMLTGKMIREGKIVKYIGEHRRYIGEAHGKFMEHLVADAWVRWSIKELEKIAGEEREE